MPAIQLPSWLAGPLYASISRLELSFDVTLSLRRIRHYPFTWKNDGQYLFLLLMAVANLLVSQSLGLLGKLFIVVAYSLGLLIPFTSQFVLPATPIFSWLLLYFTSKWSIGFLRPHIWVDVLPTLESVLYGANISDILTRYTNPTLDILAWLPYGVMHFSFPFVTAALIWIFGPPGAVKFFGKVFGYVNILGVMTQIALPCTPPWYELLHGQIPAEYGMKGSPGGLARIDAIFGGNGYTNTFTNSPMPFGAFPSLHAGCSTTDALLLNHFFPQYRWVYIAYVLWLYWSTMYLTHHYLIDLVAGASLAVGTFYYFINEDPYMRDWQLYSSPITGIKSTRMNGSIGGNGIHGDEETGTSGTGEIGGPEDFELPLRRASFENPSNGGPGGASLKDPSSSASNASKATSPRLNGFAGRSEDDTGSRPRTPRLDR